jgi:dipeptidyl aminopeptidase/acylaminoacyl peptidase
MSKPKIQIQDLYRFKLVGEPQLAPDDKRMVFTVQKMDKKDQTYYKNLFMVGTDGRSLKQLTFGKRNDYAPRWSPDGKHILFVRKNEMKSQLWQLSLSGGEARVLTNLSNGSINNPVFSPDGSKIAFLFHPLGKEIELDKKGKQKTPVSRHIKDIWFRLDGEGWFDSEFSHIWIADVSSGKAWQLVKGNYHDSFPCWHPNGKELAFISFREKDWQLRLDEQDIYRVSLINGRLHKVKTPVGPKEGLSYSPDGRSLAYFGHQRPYHSWGAINYLLNTVSTDGSGHRLFGANLDRTAYPLTIGDITPSFTVSSPHWSSDGKRISFITSNDGRQSVWETNIANGKTVKITDENAVAIDSSIGRNDDIVIYHGAALEKPDELYSKNLKTNQTKQITNLNSYYINNRDFNVAEEIEFFNGRQELMGWIVKPPNFRKNKKYPMILNIHGGPRCQYGRTFFHEMQVLAAQGYVVLYTNPRGSQGYGERFADAITAKWGEPAMKDLMSAVDYAISLGYVDKNRLGVTGGSYGGYMTNWIVTHTQRFKAAVTQRCVSDLSSMFGNSDIGWDMAVEFGGTPWEARETYIKWSPITYIKNCKTPLLIIHSENDLRCNIEQGDQMYTSLKYLKQNVEYVRFPEEFHGLSRTGRPDRREERLRHIIRWFDKYLK